ncbi:hypothetical protein [Actinosynnema pretiosum]|uniref:hypothetical protein n=1 Tax=Actinosynnema pretiosum TaxID=42197 RepID=UPI001E51D1D1|nr:hypothetical protein [Actinosynnema pretiosum]
MRNKVSVLMAATLALTAAPPAHAGPADPARQYADQAVTWGECAFTPTAPLECALITVPRDWADPGSGAELEVSISRSRATGGRRGAMLVNPGGPGGQGAGLAGDLAALAPDLAGAYDLIGMDPRGTGQQGVAGSAFTCEVPADRLPTGLLDARDRSAACARCWTRSGCTTWATRTARGWARSTRRCSPTGSARSCWTPA